MKMLRVNPEERISAQQSLHHPYFKLNFNEETDSENEDVVDMDIKPSATMVTPPLTQISKNFRLKKDSCIQFVLPKENIMKGNT